MPDSEEPIPDDTRLYRRLHPDQVVWDDNEQRLRAGASSAAFKDEHLSVNLGNELVRLNETPAFALRAHPRHSLGWFTAAFARSRDQVVVARPTEDDPTHGEVVGRKTGSCATAFAKVLEIEILRREFLRPEVRARLTSGPGLTQEPTQGLSE